MREGRQRVVYEGGVDKEQIGPKRVNIKQRKDQTKTEKVEKLQQKMQTNYLFSKPK